MTGRDNIDDAGDAVSRLRREHAAMRVLLERIEAADAMPVHIGNTVSGDLVRDQGNAMDAAINAIRLYLKGAAVIARRAEASTQALREAAERLCVALERLGESDAWTEGVVAEARDALRSALSPSPAQGGAAVPAVADGYRERVQALCEAIDAWHTADRLFPERADDVLGARKALASEHPQP